MATVEDRLRTIRDGVTASCTQVELLADVEALLALIEVGEL